MRTTRAWISAKPAHVHSVCSPSRVEASAFGARGGVNPMPFIWIMMASDGPPPLTDRKSTRLNSSHEWNLVCRLLLEKKKADPAAVLEGEHRVARSLGVVRRGRDPVVAERRGKSLGFFF